MSNGTGQTGQGPQAVDPITIPSPFRDADGRPRFAMSVPRAALSDSGIKVLAYDEARRGGYEYPSRRFIDVHLRPGDLFIDIGAHWGVFAPTSESFNVFALAAEERPLPAYIKPEPRPEVLPAPCRAPEDPDVRAATTAMLMERGATDAARWADFEALGQGAEERARLAAADIAPNSRVLDLSAGTMALRGALPAGCRYIPADLVQFATDTIVVDLNAGTFPDGTFDVVVMMDVVEFLHHPQAVLAAAGRAAPRLVVSYRPAKGKRTEDRRRAGFFNDLTKSQFGDALKHAGWRVARQRAEADLVLFVCERG